jgi:uncharacterized protein
MQGEIKGWTVKRIILSLLSIVMGLIVCSALLSSWNEPQVQGKLELYQTNILLQAASLSAADLEQAEIPAEVYNSLVGKEVVSLAQTQYQAARSANQKTAAQLQEKLQVAQFNPNITSQQAIDQAWAKPLKTLQRSTQHLDLELGLLQAAQQQNTAAAQTWQQLKQELPESPVVKTAEVLTQLWSTAPTIPAEAHQLIDRDLTGWFRYQARRQLYQKQQDNTALAQLQTNQIEAAVAAIYKLATLTIVRGGGLLWGVIWGVWLLVMQLLRMRRIAPVEPLTVAEPATITATPSSVKNILFPEVTPPVTVPWDWEIVWQVILGFLVIGQLLLPLLFNLGFKITGFSLVAVPLWQKAAYILFSYLIMALGVTWFMRSSLAPYQPLAMSWFSFKGTKNWFTWGLGGYLVATPIVLLVSIVNDKIWHGQGGSNPILSIVLDSKDSSAFIFFMLTAAVAAPLFEEYLFRGFLMPSLTRYLVPWQAIVVSGVVFAAAHLSLSELLPLAVLGMILGYIYHRTGNLLASMLLHSLWNGGSLLTLYLLAS